MRFDHSFFQVVCIFSISFLVWGCDKEVVSPDIDSEMQRLMTTYDLPSVAASVFKGDSIVWKNAYGYSDKGNSVAATEETIYHIGSISKLFIATAVMQLDEQGKIDIDTDINQYLPVSIRNPHFPEAPITARMLLTHSAGLAWPLTYPEALGIWDQFAPDQAPSPSEWVPQFLVPSGVFYNPLIWKDTEPGQFEAYSNIGCNVLAYLVEEVSGQNFRDYCKTHLFSPLNMPNTSYNCADLDNNKLAVLYKNDNTPSPFFEDRIYPCGGLKTTLEDLCRFLMAYNNGGQLDNVRILKESTVNRLLQVQNPVTGTCLIWNASFGGWFGHEGGLVAGATAIADIQKAHRVGFVIFCNKHPSPVGQGHEIYGLVRQKANEYIE